MNDERLLVAIPAYRCADQVGRVLNQMVPKITDFVAEVLVLDNHSPDNTLERAIEGAKNNPHIQITVVRNKENYNLGGTHKVAFQYCLDKGYGGVIILHGDDQGAIEDFFPVLTSKKYLEYDCVLGARFKKGSKITGYSKFRIFGNLIFNWIYSLVVFKSVSDMGSGLNLYKTSIIQAGFYKFMPDDLTFNNCMLLATYAHNMKVHFEPISWREEDQVSNASLFNQSKKLVRYLLLYVFNKKTFFDDKFRNIKRDSYLCEVIFSNRDSK